MLSPDQAVRAFLGLGCEVVRRSRDSHIFLERRDEHGHQIAVFSVPTNRNPISPGILRRLLHSNGIRDEEHLAELLSAPDPARAFLAVLPPQGPRYRPSGQ